jgi:hypothetical protein
LAISFEGKWPEFYGKTLKPDGVGTKEVEIWGFFVTPEGFGRCLLGEMLDDRNRERWDRVWDVLDGLDIIGELLFWVIRIAIEALSSIFDGW